MAKFATSEKLHRTLLQMAEDYERLAVELVAKEEANSDQST